MKRMEMKKENKKGSLKTTRQLLKIKVYIRNLIKGINDLAVSLTTCFEPFLLWTREEFKEMERRIRKLMTMSNALHTKFDVDRLYVSRKEG